jgi:hypothetical protein
MVYFKRKGIILARNNKFILEEKNMQQEASRKTSREIGTQFTINDFNERFPLKRSTPTQEIRRQISPLLIPRHFPYVQQFKIILICFFFL